ncbi:hypothetical protein [Hyphobacterium marinum]|uniref:Uncharacterized protein n=1 Tax=Hyphobacterium marinum TaxID=3116574 RepID=A0ABU7LVN3_9PROT|nr:hypothetical protein [Hyphobacterium sp. Y6023]MEE2565624.1 hypothetical protein [Hyphobacterium sp. Y6023]
MSPSDLESDIAYMRGLAESGERAPLIGGRYLLIWGGLAALACLAHWSILTGLAGLPDIALPVLWAGYGMTGGILVAVFGRGLGRKPGARSIGNRVNRAAWVSVGLGIVLYVVGVAVSITALDAPIFLYDTILTVALFGYSIAFSVTASLSGQKWLFGPAWMSIAGAALSPAFLGKPELYLLAAGIIFFAAVIPAFRMIRNEPKAIV